MTDEIESDEPLIVIDADDLAAARGFAQTLIADNCENCKEFPKALAKTPCICATVKEQITAMKKTQHCEDMIIAEWMNIQKVNREVRTYDD